MNRTQNVGVQRKKDDGFSRYYDFTLMFMVVFICAIGLIIIYSSSAYSAQKKNLASTHFFTRQLRALIIGSFIMLLLSKISVRWLRVKFPLPFRLRKPKLITIIMFLTILLQIFVSFFVTAERNGSTRWVTIPILGNFQVSEVSKLVLILYTANLFSSKPKALGFFFGFVAKSVPAMILIFAIAKENLSAGVIAFGIYFAICFVQSRKYMYFFILAIVSVLGIVYYLSGDQGYRNERVRIWKNVETHEKGEQIRQGLFAIASGGFFGTGLGNSAQKYGRVPEAYNDMVFTIICEELGIVGAFAIIVLFAMLIFRLFIIAFHCDKQFEALIVVGVMTQIAFQVVLNIAVVTNLIPSTGITLPFISYGGSSILVLLAEVGIVLNISSKIRYRGSRRSA